MLCPESLRVKTSLLPCFLAQTADHIPCFAAAIFQRSLCGNAVFTTYDAAVGPGEGEDPINQGAGFECFLAVGALVEVDEHDHGCVHGLVVSGPAPLEGLEVRVAGEGDEFFHEAMAVAEGAVLVRLVLLKMIMGEHTSGVLMARYGFWRFSGMVGMRRRMPYLSASVF